jgi:hypothetical protein
VREQVFDEAKHIRHIRLQGDKNNNKMERMNGEIRDREKTMRELKQKRTVILQGISFTTISLESIKHSVKLQQKHAE